MLLRCFRVRGQIGVSKGRDVRCSGGCIGRAALVIGAIAKGLVHPRVGHDLATAGLVDSYCRRVAIKILTLLCFIPQKRCRHAYLCVLVTAVTYPVLLWLEDEV